MLKRIIIYAIILIIFIFFTTPLAAASAIEGILSIPEVQQATQMFKEIGGSLAGFFFQYLPSLLILVSSALLPILIYQLTKTENLKTYSEFRRILMVRVSVFLFFNTLILPILALASISGVITYFAGSKNVLDTFSKIFVPESGALFINFILNKTLWGLYFTLVHLVPLLLYIAKTAFSNKNWGKRRRRISPGKVLNSVEAYFFNVETEYALSISVLAIVVCFGLYSPFILLVGLLFFILRYYVDRFTIARTYSHRMIQQEMIEACDTNKCQDKHLLHNQNGALFEYKSDYIAHRRLLYKVMELVIACLLICNIFLVLFFASKITKSAFFVFHLVIECIVGVALILGLFVIRAYSLYERRILLDKWSFEKLLENKRYLENTYSPLRIWEYKMRYFKSKIEDVKKLSRGIPSNP